MEGKKAVPPRIYTLITLETEGKTWRFEQDQATKLWCRIDPDEVEHEGLTSQEVAHATDELITQYGDGKITMSAPTDGSIHEEVLHLSLD